MASVPCTAFAAARVHNSLAYERMKSQAKDDPCAPDPYGQSAARPALATYFMKNGQMFSQGLRTNPDGSTSAFVTPVDNLTSMCAPSVLIRSDKYDPTTFKQAELKPVSSQKSPGVGPRKG